MTKPSTSTNLAHATLYFILGALGLSLAISPGYSSPIFPAAGLALALSIRFGRYGVVAVFIGSFALNYSQSLLNARGFADAAIISALIASGSALQCTIGAALVRRFLKPGWEYLDNEKSIFHLLLVGGVVACLCSATVGVGSMYLLSIIDHKALRRIHQIAQATVCFIDFIHTAFRIQTSRHLKKVGATVPIIDINHDFTHARTPGLAQTGKPPGTGLRRFRGRTNTTGHD